MATSIKCGSFTGNGSAQNISIGFVPDFVLLLNATDGDSVDLWFNGMTAATSVNIAAAAATRAASDGITAYEGSTTAGAGFTVGAGISESGKTVYYVAIESGPGAN